MKPKEVIRRLEDHFAIHNDGRPTPYLDEAVRTVIEALKRQMWIPANVLPEAEDEHGNSKDVLVVRQRYFKGNALKYISRHGKKAAASPGEDLKKAVVYLNWAAATAVRIAKGE